MNKNNIIEEKEPLQGPSSMPLSETEKALTTINTLYHSEVPVNVVDSKTSSVTESDVSSQNAVNGAGRMVSSSDFLRAFFNPNETINIKIHPDRNGDPYTGEQIAVEAINFSNYEDDLVAHNLSNRGISFVVNHGGSEDEDINRINANFVLLNDTIGENMSKLQSFPLEPSIVVSANDSVGAYWIVDGEEVTQFRSIQTALAKHLAGDPSFNNESHTMRLPGLHDCSHNPPAIVKVERFHPELHYSPTDIITALGDDYVPDATDNSPAPEGTDIGLSVVSNTCCFMAHCINNAANLTDDQMNALVSNLAPFEGGRDALHSYASLRPGYIRANLDAKINAYLSNCSNTTSCEQIKAQGFNCIKKANGVCKCNSPSDKAIKPLTVDEIKEIISNQPVTGTLVEDMKTAEQLVKDYLFSLDSGMAEALINEDIKNHFHLSFSAVKPLIKTYNQVSKTYLRTKAKREKSIKGSKLPEWYKIGKNGYEFLPDILADHCATTKAVFCIEDTFYLYQNGVYRQITKKKAKKIIRKHMLRGTIKSSQISDALEQWSIVTQKEAKEVNANPYLINLKNGLYNVMDDTFVKHNEKILMTTQLPVSYTPGATCPQFLQYLSDLLEPDQIPLIQEWMGYSMVPLNHAQKALLLVGKGNTGKSVLLRTIKEVLIGIDNVSHIAMQDLDARFRTAELFGKLVNEFADLPSKNLTDNGMFKALTGEDYVTAERKGQDPFVFQNTATLIFSCNELPHNYGDNSTGFYRRLSIVECNNVVPEDKRDPELVDKFRREGDGIFLFALEGLRRLIMNKYCLSESQTNKDAIARYMEEGNSVLLFVREKCVIEPGACTNRQGLYDKYRDFCDGREINSMSLIKFNKEIVDKFPGVYKKDTSYERIWSGIKLC